MHIVDRGLTKNGRSPHIEMRCLPQFFRQIPISRHLSSDWLVIPGAFAGTDRGLLRSVLRPWSPVPKCNAPRAPISVEEHTSMAPRPRRKVRILRFKNLLKYSGITVAFKTTFEVFTRVGPDNSLERLTERSVGLVTDQPSDVYELFVTLL